MRESTEHIDTWSGLRVLSEEECWARLQAGEFGRLAVTVGTTPDIFPVNYRVHRDEIVIRTEAGTKLAAGTLMPVVAFEIDGVDLVDHEGWSVVVKGRGHEPDDDDHVAELEALGMEPWVDVPKPRWLVITPTEVTGRSVPTRQARAAST